MPGAPEDPPEIRERLWAGTGGALGWDAGANSGQTVTRMVTLFRHVVAFEPADESFAALDAAWGTDPRVTLRREALSRHSGWLTASVRAAPIQTGQLVATGMPYRGEGAGEPGMADWGEERGTRQVPCVTADEAARGGIPDFVKVDTEGHEVQVLEGAAGLLALGTVSWLIEFHDAPLLADCLGILDGAGYAPEIVRHPHYPEGSRMWSRHGWIRADAPRGEVHG